MRESRKEIEIENTGRIKTMLQCLVSDSTMEGSV